MVDILHRVGMEHTTPEAVYEALTTVDGLARWWTTDTRGSGEVGEVLEFHFPPVGSFGMQVLEVAPGKRVTWRVVDGPAEWHDTTVDWELRQDGDWTIVLFTHAGWREPGEFMHHCSTKWGSFLLSLKQLVETGTGAPAPQDVQISNWH